MRSHLDPFMSVSVVPTLALKLISLHDHISRMLTRPIQTFITLSYVNLILVKLVENTTIIC